MMNNEEDSTDDSGEELETDPAMDRTSSGHVLNISKWTFGELKLDPIPKVVASNIPNDADEYFFTSHL